MAVHPTSSGPRLALIQYPQGSDSLLCLQSFDFQNGGLQQAPIKCASSWFGVTLIAPAADVSLNAFLDTGGTQPCCTFTQLISPIDVHNTGRVVEELENIVRLCSGTTYGTHSQWSWDRSGKKIGWTFNLFQCDALCIASTTVHISPRLELRIVR